jgi:broad specificity phosphatase PhoE
MRLILMRHGETEHNRGQLTLGRADVPLNARGLLQAQAVAASFGRRPSALYVSPLQRARQTAAAIEARMRVPAVVDDGLIEMDVGEMEHLTGAELRERYPEFLRLWLGGGEGESHTVADARMPGGETLAEVQARAWGAIERMRATHPAGSVAVVTHNFVILTLMCRALGLPLSGFRRLRAGVASRTVIDINDAGDCRVLQMNDVAHLLAVGLADDPSGREARP